MKREGDRENLLADEPLSEQKGGVGKRKKKGVERKF